MLSDEDDAVLDHALLAEQPRNVLAMIGRRIMIKRYEYKFVVRGGVRRSNGFFLRH
jgi:hypothetical protein